MGLMDAIAADVDSVFFDESAFASIHNVDGEDIPVVMDEAELSEMSALKRKVGSRSSGWMADVNEHSLLFFAKEKDIARKLTVNSSVEFDGRLYFVHHVQRAGGCYKILLGREQV